MISIKQFLINRYNLLEEKKRNYKNEYKKYHSSPEAKKNRGKRVKIRRILEKSGRVHKNDGMDIDHKKALSKGGSNSIKNVRVISKHKNRGKDNN